MSIDPLVRDPDPAGIALAASVLRDGGLVAFPTETVYGLGADALDPVAVARVFAAKGRPADNPTIVHLADASAFEQVVAEVTPLARRLAREHLPGPLTLVLDSRPDVPRVTTGGLSTVAVRVPDHPVAAAFLEQAARPVAAPSANSSGRPSPTTAMHVVDDLGNHVDLIIDGGPCPVGVESTVVDARGSRPVVLREGSITREELGISTTSTGPANLAASPGTRYAHYAPRCALVLAPGGTAASLAQELSDAGQAVGMVATVAAPAGVVEVARFVDAADLAKQLYAALRSAEEAAVDVVVVEQVPPAGVGRAVMDRLLRAAAGAHAGDHAGDR